MNPRHDCFLDGFGGILFGWYYEILLWISVTRGGVASVGYRNDVPIFGWDGYAMRLVNGRGC